jgi:hypothetical protein
MVSKNVKSDTEIKYDLFQKGYAESNALCSRQDQGDRWFSKILRNIWGWYVKILTIPYRGGWVVWKRPKITLRNIKMAP